MRLKRLPSHEDYFSKDPLLSCPELVCGLLHDRCNAILSCLHLNDNTTAVPRGTPAFDRLHKVRPMIEMLKKSVQKEYKLHSSRCDPLLSNTYPKSRQS